MADNIFKKMARAVEETAEPVKAGDEQVFKKTPRNVLVKMFGLPNSWSESVADEKKYYADLPASMATAGRAAKVTKPNIFGSVTVKEGVEKLGTVIRPNAGESVAQAILRQKFGK